MKLGELRGPSPVDVDLRPNSRSVRIASVTFALISVLLFIFQNYLYVRAGMLRPDFGIIHSAYNFNFFKLPLILLGIAFLYAGLALRWSHLRPLLLGFGAGYMFACIDLWALRYYVTHIEPERLVVRHIQIKTPKLTQPVRILHLTDIQAGSIGPYQKAIFDTIDSLKPDLILNSGDFLQVVLPATFESEWPKLHALIRRVNPRLGTYGVFGDAELEGEKKRHMYQMRPEELAPLVMLASKSVRIDTGFGPISLLGLNLFHSQNYEWAQRSIKPWLQQSDPNDFRIVLGHSPNFALGLKEAPIDLCLAGHTHGGQVRVPFYGALINYSEVPREWLSGFRSIGIPYLNVSAGAGSNRKDGLPPIRFNCPTEITLLELLPTQSPP